MKNLIVITLLGLSACQSLVIAPDPTPAPSATVSPSPTAAPSSGTVHFISDPYYTTVAERELVAKAEKKVNEVIHSDCFFNFMANRKMIQTDGKTPVQVAEEFKTVDGSIPVQFYYSRFTSTRAYRQPPSNVIHINRKFVTPDSDLCEVSGTFAHESIGHSLLGYSHDMQWSPSREFSAPYSSDHAFAPEPYSMSDSGGCCK